MSKVRCRSCSSFPLLAIVSWHEVVDIYGVPGQLPRKGVRVFVDDAAQGMAPYVVRSKLPTASPGAAKDATHHDFPSSATLQRMWLAGGPTVHTLCPQINHTAIFLQYDVGHQALDRFDSICHFAAAKRSIASESAAAEVVAAWKAGARRRASFAVAPQQRDAPPGAPRWQHPDAPTLPAATSVDDASSAASAGDLLLPSTCVAERHSHAIIFRVTR